jgi:hypothetical protein
MSFSLSPSTPDDSPVTLRGARIYFVVILGFVISCNLFVMSVVFFSDSNRYADSVVIHESILAANSEITDLRVMVARQEIFSKANRSIDHRGVYDPQARMLWVNIEQEPQDTMQTMMHEYAHYVYYQVMNKTEREEWNKISDQSTVYVSKYAQTDAGEDFAETFAETITCTITPKGKGLPIDNKKADYIQRIPAKKLQEKGALQ